MARVSSRAEEDSERSERRASSADCQSGSTSKQARAGGLNLESSSNGGAREIWIWRDRAGQAGSREHYQRLGTI